jgi:BMFP domain-containing protein YqiC
MATLESIEQKLTLLDAKFEARFVKIDEQFIAIDRRFEKIDKRFDMLLDMIIMTNKTVAALAASVAKLESKTSERFDRLEKKLSAKIESEVNGLALITEKSFRRAEKRFERLERHAGLAFYTQ